MSDLVVLSPVAEEFGRVASGGLSELPPVVGRVALLSNGKGHTVDPLFDGVARRLERADVQVKTFAKPSFSQGIGPADKAAAVQFADMGIAAIAD